MLTELTSAVLLAILLGIATDANAACTSISRTNSSALSVLTSTKYNTDLNTVYTAVNNFDGGCITSGTLESDALDTTDFAPLLKGLKEGCKVQYSNASTVNISECLASVNGNFVTTTTNTSASFGCTGCSAEVATTTYYVYIQTGSSGSTLTPLILTGAPNDDGYDGSGNKVLGRFYNNGSGDIDQFSIYQWKINDFSEDYIRSPNSSNGKPVLCSADISGTGVISNQDGDCFASCTNATTPVCTFTTDYWSVTPKCWHVVTGALQGSAVVTSTTFSGINLNGSFVAIAGDRSYFCHGVRP